MGPMTAFKILFCNFFKEYNDLFYPSPADSEASPLAPISNYTLKARSDMASFVDSLVAPLSLVNALLVAVSRKKNDDLAHTFQTLEDIWDEYGVYEKVQD